MSDIKLIRVRRDEPVYQFGGYLIGEPGPGQEWAARHFDYVTPDGRWRVAPMSPTCCGRWEIIDATGEFETELVDSLDFARDYITEAVAESEASIPKRNGHQRCPGCDWMHTFAPCFPGCHDQ